MLMSGPQMGTFSFGPKAAFPSNPPSSQQRCLISARPISRIRLNFSLVGKSWVLDATTVKPRFRCALGVVVEKGVEFSPSFDDYVKVMEAVKTERSKNSGSDVGKEALDTPKGVNKLVRSNRGRRVKNSEDGRGEKSGENGDVESNASGWGLVGGILEKARAGRSGDERESSYSYRRLEGTGGTVDRHFKKKDVRVDKYLRNQNGRDGRRVSEHGITNERKEASVYRRYDKSGEMKDVRIDKYLRNQNGRDGQRVSGHGITNERKEASVYRRYEKSGETKKAGNDLRPWRQEFGNSDNEELSEKQVEQKGKWARENNNDLTNDGFTYKSKMERNSNGKLGDTTRKGSDFNRRVHKFGYDDNSEEFRKLQVRRSGMRTLEIDDERNMHEDALKGGRVWNRPHQPKSDLDVTGKEFLKRDGNGTHLRFQGDATQTTGPTSGSIEMRGRSGKNVSRNETFVGRDIYDIDHEDRAAFRTFEVFTDVRNRPRILRMEMEERIEKLAKWLNAKDVNMPEWQFSKMMHSANFKFTDHTILRVVQILGALGNWRRVLQVVEWLHSRERFISYKSRFIYTTVLNVLGKAKRPTEALNIFYAMRQELSSYPDLAAYHCIAVTLGQAGHIKELFDVIDCMRAPPEKKFKLGPLQKWDPRLEPDLVIYNAVLNACVQQKQWEGAFWVLQQLKQCSIKPTNTTYGLAMEVMLACGKYNLVHEFFRKVNKNSVPKALNYKVLINTLWREGKIDEAVRAVQDMERRGIVGSASLYYDLARCLCSAGRCQEALLQVDKICKVAKKPLVVTYTGLIQACLNSGNIDNAAYIFNQMHKFCSPNTVTCNIMLKSYLEHGMFEEAKELFHKILDGSHDFDSKSSLRQKVIPDKFMFNTMMEACAATNKWDDFENVYRQMLYHGFHFDSKRHLRMVLDAFRAGKVQVMETTWEYLVRSGRVPPPPIIKERFCLKLEEDDPVAAVACIGIHQDNDILAFSEKAWLNLINSSADRLRNNTVTRLVLEVNNAQSDCPHPIFQNLLNACNGFLTSRGNLVDVSEDDRKLTMIHT